MRSEEYIPAIVMLVGLALFIWSHTPKDRPVTWPREVGRIMFWVGLLIVLFRVSRYV
jgi:hypothetical protein